MPGGVGISERLSSTAIGTERPVISNYPGSQCRQAATRVKLEICRPGLVLHAVIMLHAVIVFHGVVFLHLVSFHLLFLAGLLVLRHLIFLHLILIRAVLLHAVLLHAVIMLHGVAAGLRKRRQGHRQETHGHESTNQLFHKILLVVLDGSRIRYISIPP